MATNDSINPRNLWIALNDIKRRAIELVLDSKDPNVRLAVAAMCRDNDIDYPLDPDSYLGSFDNLIEDVADAGSHDGE